jgi:hypothetical protein
MKLKQDVAVGYGYSDDDLVLTLRIESDSCYEIPPLRAKHMALQILTTLKLMEEADAADEGPA